MKGLEHVRILDLQIFREVCRAKSIRAVARRMSLTPGQVSKNVQGLEKKVGFKIFKRSAAGVLLTEEGTELLGLVGSILETLEKVDQLVEGGTARKQRRMLAFASTSFLTTHLIVPSVSGLVVDDTFNFRFLDLAPDLLVPSGMRGAFEIAIHFGKIAWPHTWESEAIGKSKWVLTVRGDHPLKPGASIAKILEHPFVVPTYWTAEGLMRGDDQFPVPLSKRRIGFETATADAAVPVLLNTHHVAFLPEILVQPWVKTKELKVIPLVSIVGLDSDLPGGEVEKELFLSFRTDLVPAKFRTMLAKGLRESLKQKTVRAKSKKSTPPVDS